MESPEDTAEPLPKILKVSDSSSEEKECEAAKSNFAALKKGIVVEVQSDQDHSDAEDAGQFVIEDFEFVSVPTIKVDPSELCDDNDPFLDVQLVSSPVGAPSTSNPKTVIPFYTLKTLDKPVANLKKARKILKSSDHKKSLVKLHEEGYNTYLCLHCDQYVEDLDLHLNTEECFHAIMKCSNCQRLFDGERNYMEHFSFCALNKITCEFCGIEFCSSMYFTYHWYNMHSDMIPTKLDRCAHCANNWCQMLVGTGRPKCIICCSFYTTRSSLMRHLHESHLTADHQIKRILKKRLTCSYCYINCSTSLEFYKHIFNSSCRFLKCQLCGSVFTDLKKINYHKTYCHKPDADAPVPNLHHQCSNCGLHVVEPARASSLSSLDIR